MTPYIVASDKKGPVECIAESPVEEPELMSSESINLLFILFAEHLAEKTGTAKSYDDLAVICYKLGSVYQTDPDIELLKKARDIFRMLAENCPGVKRVQTAPTGSRLKYNGSRKKRRCDG